MRYHPMHMCGVWMVRKQNITDPKAKGIRPQVLENRHWGWCRREGARDRRSAGTGLLQGVSMVSPENKWKPPKRFCLTSAEGWQVQESNAGLHIVTPAP